MKWWAWKLCFVGEYEHISSHLSKWISFLCPFVRKIKNFLSFFKKYKLHCYFIHYIWLLLHSFWYIFGLLKIQHRYRILAYNILKKSKAIIFKVGRRSNGSKARKTSANLQCKRWIDWDDLVDRPRLCMYCMLKRWSNLSCFFLYISKTTDLIMEIQFIASISQYKM